MIKKGLGDYILYILTSVASFRWLGATLGVGLALSLMLSAVFSLFEGVAFFWGYSLFIFVFKCIEQIAVRILGLGEVRGGVLSSMGWVAGKFIGPACFIWLGFFWRFSAFLMFLGLLAGLVVVTCFLVASQRKNPLR